MDFINKTFYHTRLHQDRYFMEMAHLASARSPCLSRSVGCILVNNHNHVIATGYNGPPTKFPHCTKDTCPRINTDPGTQLDKCFAVHAEANALLQCKDVHEIKTAYCTDSPCLICICMLLNTSCERIIFDEEYPNPEARDIWKKAGRTWIKISDAAL